MPDSVSEAWMATEDSHGQWRTFVATKCGNMCFALGVRTKRRPAPGRLWKLDSALLLLWLSLTSTTAIAAAPQATNSHGSVFGERMFIGFTPESSTRERGLEAKFDSLLEKANLQSWLKLLSAHPHHLGSPYDKTNAEFVAAQFRSWGYDTGIEEFEVLFPTPKTRLVEMVAPESYLARLDEPALKEDSTSGQAAEQLPVYNAYSCDGDVTADVVYVNYGIPKDYERLAELGIDVKGKIVLARYLGSWRGIKPKVAAEHGAIGCLIYSDPRDDGYFQGDSYPKGGWRPEFGAQRGSVVDMPVYPGDPLTPGVGATKDAQRLPLSEAATITKIPVLPISYGDALPLLRAMGGPLAPEEWRGSLPLTYHVGPGPTRVRLKVEFDWKTATAYDVIARMTGSERPAEWVIRGNHHDAWVNGACDPLSGAVCVMEEARIISELRKTGWQPKRTLVFTIWDGEEPGLLGSTEWAETHAEELGRQAVAYINSDTNGRGFLGAEGSHTLEQLVNEVARDVVDPEKHISVAERARAKILVGGTAEERREARDRDHLRIGALGSGSDYSAFLQHLGIASLNLGYAGEAEYSGVYHSIYDSYDHFTRFVDPHFDYGVALTQTAGRAVLRMAEADVLPFEFLDLSDALDKYLKEITKLIDEMREETKQKNRLIADKTLEAAADPAEPFLAPALKDPVPFLNFAPIQNTLSRIRKNAEEYDKARRDLASGRRTLAPNSFKALDSVLLSAERAFIRNEGLPRRPWYRHLVYAPGFYTGYGVKTMPGVREAIEQRNWTEAQEQVGALASALDRFADQIEQAVKIARNGPG